MNAQDAARVLAAAAAYDQRTVGEADARAWAAALPDIHVDDALTAVVAWYARNPERIMPAHVRRLAVAAANDRHDRTPPDQRALPTTADGHEIDDVEFGLRAWIGGWRQTQGDGPAPPYRLAIAVQRSVHAWVATGMARAELARAMWSAGRELVILPPPPGAEPAAEPAAEQDEPFRTVPA